MSDEGRSTIFLSYAHSDKARAQRLAAALEQSGYTVWWDALIEGGSRFARSIDEALERADAVIVLWSKNSIESDWVRDEASHARERHRLVPVSLDGSAPPLGFRQYQMIDLSKWRGKPDSPQMEAIRRAIAAAVGQQLEPAHISKARVDRRKAMLIGGSAAATAAAAGAVGWQVGLFGGGSAEARSIAIVPFKNLSGDSSQAFLSDGLTEEVRAALARNPGLLVMAGTSSDTARDEQDGAKAIARKLGVAYILDGSVQRAGDRVRVATNLTNGKTGFSEWSQRLERKLDDIFAFQSEIAQSVSNALSVRMATDAPALGGTRNAAAYEAYLRGKSLYNLAKDAETDRQARANFEVAVAADPNFALAHAALSRVLSSTASSHAAASDLKPLYSAAVQQAQLAIDLAPKLAEGNLALGYAKFAGFLDVRGAKPSYDKAYEYGRGDADVVLLYALYAVRARRFAEARSAIDRALALDPLNPRTHRAAGLIAYSSRRYGDAVAAYRDALRLNPEISNANAFLGNALLLMNRPADARTAIAAEKSDMFRLTSLAILEHREGNQAAAKRAFDMLVANVGDAALYQQAEVMAQAGQGGEAVVLLRRARAVGDAGLTAIASDPMLDPISRDPNFVQLVRELGFV
ncbi:MAG: TIR domain-containing protein [Sphingomonas sp.]|nr:TIR domain-containing protein [Sphingomonas sp.]